MSLNLRKLLSKLIPSVIKEKMISDTLDLTSSYSNQKITIKLAQTQSEIEAAYKLLHDTYVQSGLMSPHPSGMRVNIYSALPYTSVVIAKEGENVIGTVSLIRDSPIGFPSDKEYLKENDELRNQGFHLVEVSALAIHDQYRRNKNGAIVSLMLLKYLYNYAFFYMGSDLLCATVHPRAFVFYKSLFGASQNGAITEYKFVNKALAIHVSLPLAHAFKYMQNKFNMKPPQKNFFHFITSFTSQQYLYPQRTSDLHLDPVMTPEILEEIFIKKTGLLPSLNIENLSYIKWAYALHFSLEHLPLFKSLQKEDRSFRYLSNIPVAVVGKKLHIGKAKDISTGGLFFSAPECDLSLEESVTLIFNLKNEVLQVQGKIITHQRTVKRLGKGVGIQFTETCEKLIGYLKKSHHNHLTQSAKNAPEEKIQNVIPLFSHKKSG